MSADRILIPNLHKALDVSGQYNRSQHVKTDRQHLIAGTYTQMNIREAEMKDIFALTDLMNELGYKTNADEMKTRLTNIQNHPDHKTFVAIADGQIAGMIGMTKNYSYEQNGMHVRVLALVVNDAFRKKGIGKRLMESSEAWAKEIGANAVLLNCGNREERTVAQQFYKNIGYEIKSSGFIKKL